MINSAYLKAIPLGLALIAVPRPANAQTKSIRDITQVGPRTVPVKQGNYAMVRYVSALAGSDKDGDGSPQHPWASVLKALRESSQARAKAPHAILVGEGVYNRDTIVMREYVDLFGGFAAAGWTRDIFRHPTVLDGRNARRVVIGANKSRLDGFIIRRGRAFGHGGGILCYDAGPAITNNLIVDNTTVEPADFDPRHIHQPGHLGGGIACLYDAVPRIANNIISHNRTEIGDGGGLAFYGWVRLPGRPRAIVENNVFTGNVTGGMDFARTRSSNGGAISCSHEASPVIRNNVIAGNQAKGRSDAGGVYCEYFSSPRLEGNWIVGNIGDDDGGGIYAMRESEPVISGNYIAGNWTTGGGAGGIRISKEGRALIEHNVIAQNQTGGGLTSIDGRVLVRNNIIAENRKGPGILYQQNFRYFKASVIENNAVFGNESGSVSFRNVEGDPPLFRNNQIEGGMPGEGNRDEVPKVADDGLLLSLRKVLFDSASFSSRLEISGPVLLPGALDGRVLRLGDQWRVVRFNDKSSITVWGELKTPPRKGDAAPSQTAEILPTYRLSE